MKPDTSTSAQMSTDSATHGAQLVADQLRKQIAGKPFSEVFEVTLDNRIQAVVGDIILQALSERGLLPGDVEAVGALTPAAVPLVTSVINAASRHGDSMDGFIMDFVYPSIKGPSISGKKVVLLDAWLSEKSFIQTSSLVTLHNTNELNLDFSVVQREGAEVLAIASLIGGIDSTSQESDLADTDASATVIPKESGSSARPSLSSPSIEVIDPVTGTSQAIPFVQVFSEQELRTEPES